MPVLYEKSNPELYQLVKDRNLEQQFFMLQTAVHVGLNLTDFKFTADTLFALHSVAATFLDDTPGKIRTHPVYIENSVHTPPEERLIDKYIQEFFVSLNEMSGSSDEFQSAAFALWRLTWIHPFSECNGRTARAYSYYTLCMKLNYWPPGEETILSLMGETASECYRLLAECDREYSIGGSKGLDSLANYLKKLWLLQIQGTN